MKDINLARAPKGGCRAENPLPQIELKKTDFVDEMIRRVLRDLPFTRNQPLKSDYDK
jgi:hypothetical protein